MFWAHVMCSCLVREFKSQSSSLESRFFSSKWLLKGCEETGLGFWVPFLLLKPTLYTYNCYQWYCFPRGSAMITYTLYMLYTEAKKTPFFFAIIQQQFTLIQLFPLLVRRILRND